MVTAILFLAISVNRVERAITKEKQSKASEECDMKVLFFTFLFDLALYVKIMMSI